MIRVPLGSPIPLNLILPGGEDNLFPQVTIYDLFMNRVAGPMVLQSVGGGVYAGTYANPAEGQYRAIYSTFADAAATRPSKYGQAEETFDVNSTFQRISTINDNVGRNSGRAR